MIMQWYQHTNNFSLHAMSKMHQFIIKISNLESTNQKKNLNKNPKQKTKKPKPTKKFNSNL